MGGGLTSTEKGRGQTLTKFLLIGGAQRLTGKNRS